MDFFDLRERLLGAPVQCKTRQQLWHYYLSLTSPEDVLLEMGVWHGTSINYMAAVRPDNAFHGFDSFQGLPEPWIAGHPKGHFAVDKTRLKFQPNVSIHAGWFEDTVPKFVAEHGTSRVRFVHFDCDLGSSTATVLDALGDCLPANKAYLLFDEFYNYAGYEDHEYRAFLNFVTKRQIQYKVMARNTKHQQALIQLEP